MKIISFISIKEVSKQINLHAVLNKKFIQNNVSIKDQTLYVKKQINIKKVLISQLDLEIVKSKQNEKVINF